MNEFLITFRIDNPMVPFINEALDRVLRNLSRRFLRKDVIEKANTTYKLLKIDFTDKANQKCMEPIDLSVLF